MPTAPSSASTPSLTSSISSAAYSRPSMIAPRRVPIAMVRGPSMAMAHTPRPLAAFERICIRFAADVLPSDVPQLRGPRGHRLRVRRGGELAAGGEAHPPRAQRVQLLPQERRRRAARVVVPPQRLPRLVPGRPRHAHERGAGHRPPRRAAGIRRGRSADAGGVQGGRRGPGDVTRLPEQPGERIDRSAPITFTFDGKPVHGFAGDTIASALYAGGRRTFSRSFKYHRRRGELCGCGQCANSLVQIGGRPGVRACAEPATEGLRVTHTNARPGLDFDVMWATDIVGGPFTPPGFYYKTFIRPRRLWPVYEKVLRSAAGLGVLPRRQADRGWRTEYRRRHCDVLVIGGGIAGLSAALRAAELGADVVLCDEDVEPGGALLHEGGHARARALAGRCAAAARRLAALYAVKPGQAAVVATTGDRGLDAALALQAAGVRIAAVADLRPDAGGGELAARVESAGIELQRGMTVVR